MNDCRAAQRQAEGRIGESVRETKLLRDELFSAQPEFEKRGQINLNWPAGELKYQLASLSP